MSKTLDIQELAIALAAKDLNPTILNPDFLKYSDIIPSDWELARPPVYNNYLAQLFFKSGVGIVAQPNRIIFVEPIGGKELKDVIVADIAHRYVEALPKVAYQAVGINPTGFVIHDAEDEAYQYMCQTLLSPGVWQQFGETRMEASVQLTYTLKRGQLNLNIIQAILQAPDQIIPAIQFSGNFNYPLIDGTQSEQVEDLKHLIRSWRSNVVTYQQLIENQFLQMDAKATPTLMLNFE